MTFSAALRQEIVREYGFPPEYIVCAYPGVDLGRFRPAEEEDSRHWSARRPRVRMLFVAHNFLLKGLHCLLIALASCSQRT